jgi:hypothetical protein
MNDLQIKVVYSLSFAQLRSSGASNGNTLKPNMLALWHGCHAMFGGSTMATSSYRTSSADDP